MIIVIIAVYIWPVSELTFEELYADVDKEAVYSLVAPVLRVEMKSTYPSAAVHTFSGAGHFPYLNRAEEYTRIIGEFISIQ